MFSHLRVMGLKDALVVQDPLPPLKEEEESDPDKKKKRIEEEQARIERDEKAMDMIFINVGDKVLRNIENSKTATEAWGTLDRLYLVKSLPNRVYLQLKVYNYRMQDAKTLEENVDEFLKMISDLSNLQIQVPDEVQAILILSALPDSYDMLKETLKYGREGIKLDDVISAAKSKELELRDSSGGSRPVGEGLYVRGKAQARGSGNYQTGKGDGSKSTEGKKVCWVCGKEGHFKRQCYKWLERNKENGAGETALVKDDAQDLVGLVASEVNMSEDKGDQEEWIMDTGCSFHMTPRKEYLMDFEETKFGKVRMANNSFSEVRGVGKVKFTKRDGTSIVLQGVRYIPEISRNLISMGTLEEEGNEFRGSKGILRVMQNNKELMKGNRRASLYILEAQAEKSGSESLATVSGEGDQTQLWHSRMGHIGQQAMEILSKKGCFGNDRVSEIKFCEDCVIGKTHKASFGTAQHVTKEKLDYVHSDLWGSPNVPHSLGRCQYFISFTDDWSRKVWIYFLKTKDEAFSAFTEWKRMVETQSERKLKKLRTDNGLEFCNQKFDSLCKKEGIVRHRTCTYTPQQNGIAERLNRTIMNKVRSMLSESGLEKRFWAEAASTSVYLINRSPSSAIDNKIPEELWTSAVPNLSGLRRFGCVVYVHSQEGKLDPRAKKGIFVGYPGGVKGFRVWMIDEEKCSISRNVVFREDVMYKDILNNSISGMNIEFPSNVNRVPSFECAGTSKIEEAQVQGGATKQNSERAPKSPSSSQRVTVREETQRSHQIARDRPRRQIILPSRLNDYELDEEALDEIAGYAYHITEDGGNPEPTDYQEALQDPDCNKWLEAADEEIESLIKNKTWILVERNMSQKPIGCKWYSREKQALQEWKSQGFKPD